MRLTSHEPFWLLKNGLIQSYPSLGESIKCEVLIVGGGITGSLMSFQLAKEGYDIVLLDKRDVGRGSTSATTSMLQYEIDKPLYSLIEMVGEEMAVDSYLEGIKSINKLEAIVKELGENVGFERKKSIQVARSNKDTKWLRQEYEVRKKYGINVEWISQSECLNTFGIKCKGGLLSHDAASVDAYTLTHKLLKYGRDNHNLRVFDHTELLSVKHKKSDNIVKTEGNHLIECKHIVYATGFESQKMIKEKVVDLISTYALVSEPIPHLQDVLKNILIWDTESPYLYMRTTDDNRILVGGEDEKFKNPMLRDKLIERKELKLLKKFRALMSGLNIIPDFCWAGTFGQTKDALPYIGAHPDFPNSYFVLGFGGNGITFSVMGMELISDALKDKNNRFLTYYRFNRK